jgi:uncharacterized protein YecE (DUF72 family)
MKKIGHNSLPTAANAPAGSTSDFAGGVEVAGAVVRVGPAGWSYPDWSGYVYPTRRAKGFHEATYLAQFFDTIEINTSFYAPVRAEHAAQWIERVAGNPRFLFTAKLWQRFTHDPAPTAADERAVRAGFDVLRDAERLGAVLVQFPFAFHNSPETIAYLGGLLKRFADYPLVVEVRHASWKTDTFFELLRERGVGFCNLDQPVIGRSLEPTAIATSTIGYVRLHGRRYDTWFSDDPETPSHERYNYLYPMQELAPWAERTREVAKNSRSVYVVTNNHYLGKGAVNALELISLMKGGNVEVPEPLRKQYPELNEIADRPAEAPTLFEMKKDVKK